MPGRNDRDIDPYQRQVRDDQLARLHKLFYGGKTSEEVVRDLFAVDDAGRVDDLARVEETAKGRDIPADVVRADQP